MNVKGWLEKVFPIHPFGADEDLVSFMRFKKKRDSQDFGC